jgi:Domain of unknown function (DUF4185)
MHPPIYKSVSNGTGFWFSSDAEAVRIGGEMEKLLVCAAALLGIGALTQNSAGQQTKAPDAGSITYVAGSSQKICQLTGEMDQQLQRPTVNRTGTQFGLVFDDLGYSFEHDGKLFFLFGDSHPRPKFNGKPNGDSDPPRLVDDNDAIAFTTDTSIANCLKLDFIRDAIGAYKNPVVLNGQGQPAIKLRTNEIPIAGISQGGSMFVIFGTDNPTDTPTPGQPLGYATRSVVAVSNDDAQTFHYLYDLSKGPDARFINTAIAQGTDGYIYFWGTQGGGLYRKSAPYLARMPSAQIGKPNGGQSLQYFTGSGADQTPSFSKTEADAIPLFQDYPAGSSTPQNCMGELGVEWNQFVKHWVMLYNCSINTPANPRGIYMRVAQQPWGPWSAPQTIFNPMRDGGLCHFMHRAVTPQSPACDNLTVPNRLDVAGGAYGPYFISRFTTGDAAHGTSTFYYTMSTWNPYTQVIMKTTIQTVP